MKWNVSRELCRKEVDVEEEWRITDGRGELRITSHVWRYHRELSPFRIADPAVSLETQIITRLTNDSADKCDISSLTGWFSQTFLLYRIAVAYRVL